MTRLLSALSATVNVSRGGAAQIVAVKPSDASALIERDHAVVGLARSLAAKLQHPFGLGCFLRFEQHLVQEVIHWNVGAPFLRAFVPGFESLRLRQRPGSPASVFTRKISAEANEGEYPLLGALDQAPNAPSPRRLFGEYLPMRL